MYNKGIIYYSSLALNYGTVIIKRNFKLTHEGGLDAKILILFFYEGN